MSKSVPQSSIGVLAKIKKKVDTKTTMAVYRDAVREHIPPEMVVNVLESLYQTAVGDEDHKPDSRAAKTFLEYVLGKPRDQIDEREDVHELIDLSTFLFPQLKSGDDESGAGPVNGEDGSAVLPDP